MRQNAKKFVPMLGTLILAVLLVGTAALAPCLVSAEDGGGGPALRDSSGIRIEGAGGGEHVAPALGSPGGGGILFEQPPTAPDQAWAFYTSDTAIEGGPYLCLDDFWGLTREIRDIHWYGTSLTCCWNVCDPTGMEFEIIFYQDAGGAPGAPVATFSNVIPTITYYDTFAGFPAYRFETDLGMPVSLTTGWVSIQSTYSPNGCAFLWLNSFTGNWNAIQQGGAPPPDNLAFALTGAPPPFKVKYLHSTGGLFNLTDPIGTQWHEIYPLFCREYHLSSWEDNGDGVLSPCDQIDMYEKPDGEVRWYHVENVTITLLVTPVENHMVDENGFPPLESPPQGAGKSMYIELEGGYNASVLTNPVCTQWHEIYPVFCREYHLSAWSDTDELRKLDPCDDIWLTPKDDTPICPLDEDFSGSWPPSGWTQEDPREWYQSATNSSGGKPPEARLNYFNISGNYAYLDSKPVDTTGAPSLTLEFKSFINDDELSSNPYNCTVCTRADGGDGWTDVTPWSNPIYGDVGPNTYLVDISSDIGSATQVRFEFAGAPWIWDWYVDDVRICRPPGTWWHVEDVATDIIVTPKPPPVGGEAYPVSKMSLLAPWIAVAAILAGGLIWYVLRRRKAQS
jgi:hypothetical protein